MKEYLISVKMDLILIRMRDNGKLWIITAFKGETWVFGIPVVICKGHEITSDGFLK